MSYFREREERDGGGEERVDSSESDEPKVSGKNKMIIPVRLTLSLNQDLSKPQNCSNHFFFFGVTNVFVSNVFFNRGRGLFINWATLSSYIEFCSKMDTFNEN